MNDLDGDSGGGQSDRAYATLIEAIATCRLPPGTLFNEREAAAELGMSRTPFRQALHRLGLEGLVMSVPKRGVFVTLLSLQEIRSHMVVRQALEMELIRRTITDGLPLPLSQLRGQISEMAAVARAKDGRAFLELDEQFHMTIVSASNNRPAIDAVKRSWIHVNRARYLEVSDRPDIRAALAEHRRILGALESGDPDMAVGAIRSHLDESLRRLGEVTDRVPAAFLDKDSLAEAVVGV